MLSLCGTHVNKQALKYFEHHSFSLKSQIYLMIHALFFIAQKFKLAMTCDGLDQLNVKCLRCAYVVILMIM